MLKLPLVGSVLIHKRSDPLAHDQANSRQDARQGGRGAEQFCMDWMNDEELAQCNGYLNRDMWEFGSEHLA